MASLKDILGKVPQHPEHHPEGDVYTHSRMVRNSMDVAIELMKQAQQDPDSPFSEFDMNLDKSEINILRLAGNLHDIGKAGTTAWTVDKNKKIPWQEIPNPDLPENPDMPGKGWQAISHQDSEYFEPEMKKLDPIWHRMYEKADEKDKEDLWFVIRHHMDLKEEGFGKRLARIFVDGETGKYKNERRIKLLLVLILMDRRGRGSGTMRASAEEAIVHMIHAAKLAKQRAEEHAEKIRKQREKSPTDPEEFVKYLKAKGLDFHKQIRPVAKGRFGSSDEDIERWFNEHASFRNFFEAFDEEEEVEEISPQKFLRSDFFKKNILEKIKKYNGKVYQVGGVVRDELIGTISKDLDLVVVGLDLKELEEILSGSGKVNLVGKSYGILKFTPPMVSFWDKDEETGEMVLKHGKLKEEIDIATARLEKSTGVGHGDVEITLGKDITLDDEQMRRDFYMNVISRDVETGEYAGTHTPEGLLDVKNKIIRMTHPKAFEEDPLRMLRAVQFAARLLFKVEPKTYKKIQDSAHLITTVSKDRFNEEFIKLFTKANNPSIGLKLMESFGLLEHLFPGVNFNFDYNAIDRLPKSNYLAFLTMFFSEADPETAGSSIRDNLLHPKGMMGGIGLIETANIVSRSLEFIGQNKAPKDLTDNEVVNFLRKAGSHTATNVQRVVVENIDDVLVAKGLINKNEGLMSRVESMKQSEVPTSLKDLSISGKDIMDSLNELPLSKRDKGIMIGKTLNYLLNYAVKNQTNDREELFGVMKQFIHSRG